MKIAFNPLMRGVLAAVTFSSATNTFCSEWGALALTGQSTEPVEQLPRQMKQFEQGLGTSSSVSSPTNGTPPLPVLGARAPALPGSGADQTVAQQTSSSQAVLNYLNFSFSALMSAGVSTARNGEIRTGHPAPYERGFSLNSAELAVEGAVDPYFKAAGSVSLVLDPDGHSEVELEEAWAATTALPFGLQVKAGLFQAAFGRHNQQHAHEWAFVDQPIALTRLLGDDGLRQPGAQLSWLVPIAVYSELSLGVFNNRNPGFVATEETAEGGHSVLHGGALQDHELRGPGDLLFVPRMSVSFNLLAHKRCSVAFRALWPEQFRAGGGHAGLWTRHLLEMAS
ncbi:MAG: hypothetical protein RMH97_08170 [Verrucomicrobiales bacterium]|nr:hypothetical protein [Verrucomicrobiales bacterium]